MNNKKFISLAIALLILIGVLPVTNVFAEEGKVYKIENNFKEDMVIDDPINYDYLSYLAKNYEFGTNDKIRTSVESWFHSATKSGLPGQVLFVNPNGEGADIEGFYNEYKKALNRAENNPDEYYGEFYTRDKYQFGQGFVLSPAFTKPVFYAGGWVMMTPEYFLKEYNFFKSKVNQDALPEENLNSFGFTAVDSPLVKNGGENGWTPIVYPDIALYNMPKNISNLKIPKKFLDGYGIGLGNPLYDGQNIHIGTNGGFNSEIKKLNEMDGMQNIGEKYNKYYVLSNTYTTNNFQYMYNVILDYNHPRTFKPDNSLNFKEQRSEGTKNLIMDNLEALSLKDELDNITEEYKKDHPDEYKEYLEMYEKELEKSKIDKENAETYLNSKEWSTVPLTTYIGNVDKQTESIAYKTIEKEDVTLTKGERKVEVKGKEGSKTTITTYEVNESTGELENPSTTYENIEPVDEVVLIGTKEEVIEDSKKDNEKYPAVKPSKTEVVDEDDLTKEEKEKVVEEVIKSNPNAKEVNVKDNGDTTITYSDGSTNELKQVDTVTQKNIENKTKDVEIGDIGTNTSVGYVGSSSTPTYKEVVDESSDKVEKNDGIIPTNLGIRELFGKSISNGTKDKYDVKYIFTIGSMQYEKYINNNHESRQMDVEPYLKKERTMLPLRYVAEVVGTNVEWDNNTRTAIFEKDGLVAKIQIDGNKIEMSNGEVYQLDAKPDNINDRIFTPLTDVSKVFNLTNGNTEDRIDQNIEWDQDTQTVTIRR